MKTLRTWMFLIVGSLLLGSADPLEGQVAKTTVRGESKLRVKPTSKISRSKGVTPRRVQAVSGKKRQALKNQRVPSRPRRASTLTLGIGHVNESHCIDRVRTVRCLRNNHVHELLPGFRYLKHRSRCFRRLPCGGLEVFVPGHFEVVSREIVEPGHYRFLNSRVSMPFFGGFGGLCRSVRRKVWVPGRTRIVTERVWIPGTWVETSSLYTS